jgi:hypothetical protein
MKTMKETEFLYVARTGNADGYHPTVTATSEADVINRIRDAAQPAETLWRVTRQACGGKVERFALIRQTRSGNFQVERCLDREIDDPNFHATRTGA